VSTVVACSVTSPEFAR